MGYATPSASKLLHATILTLQTKGSAKLAYAAWPLRIELNQLTPISSKLTRLPCNLRGEWKHRWTRNLWEGVISCREPFVTVLLAQRREELLWAKSLPSKDNALEIKFDIFPTSKTEPRVQLFFSSGTGAFIQGLTTELPNREYVPAIQTPETFETGLVIPFTRIDHIEPLALSFGSIIKADVIVRRKYVWGLKPRFLGGLESPWDTIMARGRHGTVLLQSAA
jgi:hypothetical protein